MKIVSLNFEIIRATSAVAEFAVRVELDGPAADFDVTGRAVGPHCEGASTVEVAYPMRLLERSDTAASLCCVIPEPNLWKQETPFTYTVSIELTINGEILDSRETVLAFRDH